MQRKKQHTSDDFHRIIFRAIKNGISLQELHDIYGINMKTLQSWKEERQDVGKPLKQFLFRTILFRLPPEKNQKKLVRFCNKEIREMISNPDHQFKPLLNDYNSRRKKKLNKYNRKIIDKLAKKIVGVAIGLNNYIPQLDHQNSDDEQITTYQKCSVISHDHSIDNSEYDQQNEESICLYQYSPSDYINNDLTQREIEDFINEVLFPDYSQSQYSSQSLNVSRGSINQSDEVSRNIQHYEDCQDDEQSSISISNETVRRSKRLQKIQPSE